MNALVLADLHLAPNNLQPGFNLNKSKRIINNIILNDSLSNADIVIIAGDVIESTIMTYYDYNPLDALYELFEKPVIFCLGNHEFAYKKHADVIDYWSKFKHDHVHCLDIDGCVNYGNCNFVGNVLWYDFSLNKNKTIMQGEIISNWLDSSIEEFDPLLECSKCKEQIFNNLSKEKKNILITHMVPHIELNTFSREQPDSPYNAYSGCERFLLDCKDKGFDIEYAICGHTHKREVKTISDINCINIGNDYFSRSNSIAKMLIEF